MRGRCVLFAAAAALACARAPVEERPPVDPPLAVERAFAGAIPVDGPEGVRAFRGAHLRVVGADPFRLVALRLDGTCRAVGDGPARARRAPPVPGDTIEIGEAPSSDYRVGPPVACPVAWDAPPWEAVLFYEAGGALRVLPFQFVTVGPERL